jgi:two-component system chemotaxis sensor kinase CheA
VSELAPLRPDRPDGRIEGLDGNPVMRVHGRLVPVIFLDELLGLRERSAHREFGTVVLLRVDEREFGLVIDGLGGGSATATRRAAEDIVSLTTIVVKPLGALLSQIGVYAGATVLGDGDVALVLDPRGLLRAAHVPPQQAEARPAAAASGAAWIESDRYLVCRTSGGRRVAVPLNEVTRLEHYPASQLQPVAGQKVIRRHGGFTPVVDVDALLGVPAAPTPEMVHLVIVGDTGLAVRQILDVVAAESPLHPHLSMPGVVGSLSLGGIATEVLDLSPALTRSMAVAP